MLPRVRRSGHTIDSIATVPQGDGSTLVTLQITVSGDRLKRGFPAFGKYISKYVEPARYRYRLTDRNGSDWFDAEARNQLLTVRFRSHDGQLQPILGAARRIYEAEGFALVSEERHHSFGKSLVGQYWELALKAPPPPR